MKGAFKKIATMMRHQAEPEANFAFEFWDGDRVCYGDPSRPGAGLCSSSRPGRQNTSSPMVFWDSVKPTLAVTWNWMVTSRRCCALVSASDLINPPRQPGTGSSFGCIG